MMKYNLLYALLCCLPIAATNPTRVHHVYILTSNQTQNNEYRARRLLREAGFSPYSVDITFTPLKKHVPAQAYDYPARNNGKYGCIEIAPETMHQFPDHALKTALSHEMGHIHEQHHTRSTHATHLSIWITQYVAASIASHLPYIRNIPKKHWWIMPLNGLAHYTLGIPAFNYYREHRANCFAARCVGTDTVADHISQTPLKKWDFVHPSRDAHLYTLGKLHKQDTFLAWTTSAYCNYGSILYDLTTPCVYAHNRISQYLSSRQR